MLEKSETPRPGKTGKRGGLKRDDREKKNNTGGKENIEKECHGKNESSLCRG